MTTAADGTHPTRMHSCLAAENVQTFSHLTQLLSSPSKLKKEEEENSRTGRTGQTPPPPRLWGFSVPHSQLLFCVWRCHSEQECIPVGCVPALIDRMPESASGGGVCSLGGVCSRGGVCSQGVSVPRGCLFPGGCLLRGGIPACTEADTPLLTESQTRVKT